jgi:hypothetical protein
VSQSGGGSEACVVDVARPAEPVRLTRWGHVARVGWGADADTLMVSGTWGTTEMEIRRVARSGGAAVPLLPRVVLGDQDALGDFGVSPDGRLIVCPLELSRGHVWALTTDEGRY